MAFNKCFSTIYVIPEKVLSWVGIQSSKFGEQDAQEFKSSYPKEIWDSYYKDVDNLIIICLPIMAPPIISLCLRSKIFKAVKLNSI